MSDPAAAATSSSSTVGRRRNVTTVDSQSIRHAPVFKGVRRQIDAKGLHRYRY
jgi:hypothetical protein